MNEVLLADKAYWPSLARDIAILSSPDSPISIDAVCEQYGLTQQDIENLTHVPAFRTLLEREQDLVLKAGDKAGARYRALTLSQALSEKMFTEAVSGSMDHKNSVRLLEILLKSAGVLDQDRATVAVQNNMHVALPLPNIDRLAHCRVPIEVEEEP